jgi:AcrR family transcriptional regulator
MERLRERKKRETRQAIADVATMMFADRGFDQVTVAEVAVEAGVSKMTVFNYFARKEDLLLDRYEEQDELVLGAIRNRKRGWTPARAIRELLVELTRQHHPLTSLVEGAPSFWRIVEASPALRARQREHAEELQLAIARVLEDEGTDAPTARTAAGLLVVLMNTLAAEALRAMEAGTKLPTAQAAHIKLIDAQFALLAKGIR